MFFFFFCPFFSFFARVSLLDHFIKFIKISKKAISVIIILIAIIKSKSCLFYKLSVCRVCRSMALGLHFNKNYKQMIEYQSLV